MEVESRGFRGGDWTKEEIERFLKRQAVFEKEGFDESEKLAEEMLYRDRPGSGDDRRVCFECKHMRGKTCAKGFLPLRFMLQRCDLFLLRG